MIPGMRTGEGTATFVYFCTTGVIAAERGTKTTDVSGRRGGVWGGGGVHERDAVIGRKPSPTDTPYDEDKA